MHGLHACSRACDNSGHGSEAERLARGHNGITGHTQNARSLRPPIVCVEERFNEGSGYCSHFLSTLFSYE